MVIITSYCQFGINSTVAGFGGSISLWRAVILVRGGGIILWLSDSVIIITYAVTLFSKV